MTIASASEPANGTVVLTGGSPGAHTGLTYQPDAELLQRPAGHDAGHVHVHAQRRLDRDGVGHGDLRRRRRRRRSTTARRWPRTPRATAIDVLANDTDPDGGPMAIASASDPANGTVVLTGGSPGAHTGLTYEPDPNYCNNPPGTTPDTFTYTLNGGSTGDGLGHGHLRRRHPDRGQRQRDRRRGRGRERDRRAGQRHRRRRRAEDDRLGVRSGERHGGADRRLAGRAHGPDLPAGPELLQQPARHDAGHVHLHAQRRLDGDRVGDGRLRARRPGRRHLGRQHELHRERRRDRRSTPP